MRNYYNSNSQQMPLPINHSIRTKKYQPKTPPIIEIYDLEALEMDSQASSLSSCYSTNEFNNLASIIDNRNVNNKNKNYNFNNSMSSSNSSSPRSSIESNSLFHSDASFDEPFTFREFISSIINCSDKQFYKLIIQDLARLLELNFRDFNKSMIIFNKPSNQQNNQQYQMNNSFSNSSIYLNTESDLFFHIAEKIFQLASEEPNGILGTVINLRLECDNGRTYDICQKVPYDHSTTATSEFTITLKEDVTNLKKFLKNFKMYSNLGKYLAMHIDSNNFEVVKQSLY